MTHEEETNPRAAAAAAMRRLGNAMVGHDADEALLWRIAREAAATAEIIESRPPRVRDIIAVKEHLWESAPPDGEVMMHFEECIVSGSSNPMGMALKVRREGDVVVAQTVLGHAFEGAPKRAHGGAVAAIMDDVMGYVLLLEETPAYTGRLTITYRAACPVAVPLVATARLASREDRKMFITSELRDESATLIAEGDGLFIAIPRERFGT